MGKVNLSAAWIEVIDQAWPAMVLLALVKSSIYADDKWLSAHSIGNSVKSRANTFIHNRLSGIKYDDFLKELFRECQMMREPHDKMTINFGIFWLNTSEYCSNAFNCLFIYVTILHLQNQGLCRGNKLCPVFTVLNQTFVLSWWQKPQVGFELRCWLHRHFGLLQFQFHHWLFWR